MVVVGGGELEQKYNYPPSPGIRRLSVGQHFQTISLADSFNISHIASEGGGGVGAGGAVKVV